MADGNADGATIDICASDAIILAIISPDIYILIYC